MGAENDAMLSYLKDNTRFADLFNRFYFGGKQVIDPRKLEEASEVYNATPGDKGGQRSRDIKKRLKSGACLKILALEAQNDVSYIMPWRIMEYDCKEYGSQIRKVQRENQEWEGRRLESKKPEKQEWEGRRLESKKPEKPEWEGRRLENKQSEDRNVYADAGERLSRFRRKDRIAPVYTLCLYHGAEKWDGPRCLRDMMDFGGDEDWEACFADYPMRLVCANEPVDCTGFQTSLGALFALLPFRKDKAGLRKLMEENPVYQKLDEDTAKTASVLMGVKIFMQQEEKFRNGEGYNMCQAIREMMEDSRMEGEKNGWEVGIRIFIQSNRDDGVEEGVIAEKLMRYYDLSQEEVQKALSASAY